MNLNEFKMQKALHLKDELAKKNPKLQGNYLITEKFEGWFVYIYYDSVTKTWGSPISSANRIIPSMEHTATWFNRLPHPKESGILIAEAYIYEMPFQIMNGIFNRSIGNCACHEVVFKCHDWVSFTARKKALERYKDMQSLISYTDVIDRINPVEILLASSYNTKLWDRYFQTIVDRGGEGIVAKQVDSVYMPGKRNATLIKKKLECTIDCLAIRAEIGEGEKGNLSVVLVSRRKNGTEIRTVINSHKYQSILIDTPNQILGKVVTIKAMEEYADGQLRQPVFNYPRPDKEIDDYD